MAKTLELTVEEAKHRDAGRSIARISNKDMQTLGLVSGDIVTIIGKKTACAIVWPGYPEDAEKIAIRIDGDIRSNSSVGIGEKVTVQKIEAKKAKKIVLTPMQAVRIIKGNEYLKKILEGRPLIAGHVIRVEMLGSPLSFTVTSTTPNGVLLITKETEINLKEKHIEGTTGVHINYEDIGGLRHEIELVREMIELPLRHPELFQEVGIDPPKGVLLYGPPGTGKTLLAKAVANECEAKFYSVRGPDIIAKYYGESEQRLREVFEEAQKNAPAIIFIDEIDSIAPKREALSEEKQVEKRVVSQLLTLMDGLEARGKVIVIGATNIPDSLDPALRRGGRFDREIEIGIPDREGRLEILQVHTRGMPLADDVNLKEFADITHGFVGADLNSLAKEAGMHALRKIVSKIDIEKQLPAELIGNIKVTKDDFYGALKFVEPSAMREVTIETPSVTWNDIGGLDNIKKELIETVEWPLKFGALFEYAKYNASKGILLYGSPGTGKTLLAKAAAHESGVNFISIKGPQLISKYVGESEKQLRDIFRKAKQASPCILFFDEIDAIVLARGSGGGDGGTSERFISQFLAEMDGVEELKDVLVLATTNRKDLIDPALLRPGRFDRLIHIDLPDDKTRFAIFQVHTKDRHMQKVNIAVFVGKTKGWSGADIAALCDTATKFAIEDFIAQRKESEIIKEAKKFVLTAKHFTRAFAAIEQERKQEME
jgi:transitional endoplasmic reticulum ATPase